MTDSRHDISIMPIALEHVEGFHACLDTVARERRYLVMVAAPPLEGVRSFVEFNIKNNVIQFVALAGERVVGWCEILPNPSEGFTHCGTLGMGVHPNYRRRGIGRQLLEAAIAKAKNTGIKRIELEIFASNKTGITLYQKAGFSVEGVKRKERFIDGRYDDIVCMALFL